MIKSVGELRHREGNSFLKMWRTIVEPANRMLQDHRHGNFEIAVVIRGGGLYHTVSGIQTIEAGDVFVFPSNEPHWILEIYGDGLEIYNLHFNDALFCSSCGISKVYPNLFYSHSFDFSSKIPSERGTDIRLLLDGIRKELECCQPESDECIYSYLNLIYVALLRKHGYYVPQEGRHTAMERIRDSLRYIDAHFADDITLEQIAAVSGLSPNYFTSLFHECFCSKLWDHVLSKRVDEAKRLLRSRTDMTIFAIALRCGFHNTANFNRIFRRFTGMTPSQFRKGLTIH